MGEWKLNESDKKEDRFTLHKENIRITFVPQCCSCNLNINYNKCNIFDIKPSDKMKSQNVVCMYHQRNK